MIYRKGYGYQLQTDESFITKVYPPKNIITDFIKLSECGILKIDSGFAWDGPTGPVIATSNFMRASLAHDALYRLMCNGQLDRSWRKVSDKLLIEICKQDGMHALRCWYVYKAVRLFGGLYLTTEIDYEV